jgi:hypothetical protein
MQAKVSNFYHLVRTKLHLVTEVSAFSMDLEEFVRTLNCTRIAYSATKPVFARIDGPLSLRSKGRSEFPDLASA